MTPEQLIRYTVNILPIKIKLMWLELKFKVMFKLYTVKFGGKRGRKDVEFVGKR